MSLFLINLLGMAVLIGLPIIIGYIAYLIFDKE